MNEDPNKAILLQINRLRNLPALPEVNMRILNAINDPDIEIDKLADVLSMSPSLVARLLGLANSSYFGQARQVNDLPTAIFQVLGLDLVKSLSLGIVLNVQFDTGKCQAFNSNYFWTRSLLAAICAQKLAHANRLKSFSLSTVYASGLLLYIGMLVLGFLIPEEMNAIFLESKKNQICVGDTIKQNLGNSHYHFGFLLLQKWQLSPVYLAVLNHFEDPDFSGEERPLINLLTLCHTISSSLMDHKSVDMVELESLRVKLSLSNSGLEALIEELIENRENIQKLASIMGNG